MDTTILRLLILLVASLGACAEDVALAGGGTATVARLEAGGIAVAMVPELDGKLISLRGPDGYEWLSRSPRPYRARSAQGSFTDGEFDGADEIFPTMEACDGLPGHGEAWRLPWVQSDGPGLSYAVEGVRRPYRLARAITIGHDGVELAYTLDNRGDDELRYVYLFHPLFSLVEPLRLELPAGQTVRVTRSQQDVLQAFAGTRPWSELLAGPFRTATASVDARRYWSLESSPAPAFVRLRRPGGSALTMTWTREVLPHLAVWCSEASPVVGGLAHLAPEPCSGTTRRLSDAVADGTAAVVPPRGRQRWHVRLAFSR